MHFFASLLYFNRKSALTFMALRQGCPLFSPFTMGRMSAHGPATHDNTQTKTRTSCPHQDTHLQQADASEDAAIWTHGS